MKPVYLFLAAGLMIAACNEAPEIASNEKEDKDPIASVIDPLTGIDELTKVFTIDPTIAQTIQLANGGSIEFPANAFVDSNGNPVTGNVDVNWQEFHSLGDIIVSGIPMKYDSAGVANDLTSGGMFTISASQKNKDLELAPGKKAKVNLASIQDTPCYNFYELDEETGDWKYETTKEAEPLEEEEEDRAEVEKPSNILDVQVSTAKFPELNADDIVGWKTVGEMDPTIKNLSRSHQTKARLSKEGSDYVIEFQNLDVKKSVKVQPYLMEEAMADSKVNEVELNREIAELAQYQADVAAGRVIRSIEIDNFGTYNWDIINKRENSLPLLAKFDFSRKVNTDLVALYLISPDENVVVNYSADGKDPFSFDPEKKNCLIAIMPDNKLYAVSDAGFDKARSKEKGQVCTFKFKDSGIKLKSSKDIMNHLNKLI